MTTTLAPDVSPYDALASRPDSTASGRVLEIIADRINSECNGDTVAFYKKFVKKAADREECSKTKSLDVLTFLTR